MYLGLDVSTSRIGCCLLDKTGKYWWSAETIDLTSAKNLNDKFRLFDEQVRLFPWFLVYGKEVFIEEAPMMFGSGSSAQTMSMLQRFNGMISAWFMCQPAEEKVPKLIAANRARKLLGITFPKKRNSKITKQCIVDHIIKHNLMPDYEWQYKRTGNLKDHCFDAADAYVIARAGYLLHASNPVP